VCVCVCVCPLISWAWLDSELQKLLFWLGEKRLDGVKRAYWDRDWDTSLTTALRCDGYRRNILWLHKYTLREKVYVCVCVCVCASSVYVKKIVSQLWVSMWNFIDYKITDWEEQSVCIITKNTKDDRHTYRYMLLVRSILARAVHIVLAQ
jgi:hypothetical protein